jgi:hypothetical protein
MGLASIAPNATLPHSSRFLIGFMTLEPRHGAAASTGSRAATDSSPPQLGLGELADARLRLAAGEAVDRQGA